MKQGIRKDSLTHSTIGSHELINFHSIMLILLTKITHKTLICKTLTFKANDIYTHKINFTVH